MEPSVQLQLFKTFEDIKHTSETGVEFWYAKELQWVLGYSKWSNFELVISKAKNSCFAAWNSVEEGFADVGKTQKSINQYGEIEMTVPDIVLSRYACYLIAQNWDPRKTEVAFAQAYFAIQTRRYEVLEKRMEEMERLNEREKQSLTDKEFHRIAYERWVDGPSIAEITAKGDKILFWGNDTGQMKKKLGVTDSKRPLADFLPAVTINAKWLATSITNINTSKKDLKGKVQIGSEHMQNNDAVRRLLKERGITPEDLPAAEDIKEVQKRHKQETKLLEKEAKKKLKK